MNRNSSLIMFASKWQENRQKPSFRFVIFYKSALEILLLTYLLTCIRPCCIGLLVTRKPCYRKDDRTMRPIYIACLKIFESP